MADTRAELAAIFGQMAELMEILGTDRFRTNAYARAGRTMEDLTVDPADIGPDVKALSKLEGVGKSIAEKIAEYLRTGAVKDHHALLAQVPPGLPALLNVPGLGPRKVALLWQQGGVTSVADLQQKLQGDELAKLPGMGKKTLENLRRNLAFLEEASKRVSIGVALPLAQRLIGALRKVKGVEQTAYAGSLRRGRETVGDLDLLVAASEEHAEAVSAALLDAAPVVDVLGRGKTKTSVRLEGGLQVDLRIVPASSFGAALMYFTGSKEHNVALRQRAIARGMSLNEYALTRDDRQQHVAGATEQEVYAALDLKWIPPELRENRGEIALAERDALPRLIERRDIKAELHAHTRQSDGSWSIRELAEAAAARGFHTVAVTDHSRSQVQANGLDARRLERHIEDIRAVARDLADRITVLAGSEVDILADGSLDYPDSLLKELDIVVASPHSALGQNPEAATTRLLKALDNPYVTIMGHATGRLVGRREGMSPDMGRLVKAGAARGIAFEINANRHRLDLRDTHARMALEAGVKLAINTDAHGPADLDELAYGILTARRAGARADDVVNCMDRQPLGKWIASTRP